MPDTDNRDRKTCTSRRRNPANNHRAARRARAFCRAILKYLGTPSHVCLVFDSVWENLTVVLFRRAPEIRTERDPRDFRLRGWLRCRRAMPRRRSRIDEATGWRVGGFV